MIGNPGLSTSLRLGAGALATYILLYLSYPITLVLILTGADARLLFPILLPLLFLVLWGLRILRAGHFLGSLLVAALSLFGSRPLQVWAMHRAAEQYEASTPSREILTPSQRIEEVVLQTGDGLKCRKICQQLLVETDVPVTLVNRRFSKAVRLEKLDLEDCVESGPAGPEELRLDGVTICVKSTPEQEHVPIGVYLKLSLDTDFPDYRQFGVIVSRRGGAEAHEVTPKGERRLTRWESAIVNPVGIPFLPYTDWGPHTRFGHLQVGDDFSDTDFVDAVLHEALPHV